MITDCGARMGNEQERRPRWHTPEETAQKLAEYEDIWWGGFLDAVGDLVCDRAVGCGGETKREAG